MNVKIHGKQLDVGAAFETHITDGVTERVGKYFTQAVDATVSLSKDAHLICAEIVVHPGQQGLAIQTRAAADQPYPAFDAALDKLAKRLRRYKTRLNDRHGQTHAEAAELLQNARTTVFGAPDEASDGPEDMDAGEPAIVAELATPIMTLTVSEAVMNLELGDHAALLFRNKAQGPDGQLNMLYRRPDGTIGWVDPSISESALNKERESGPRTQAA